MSENVTVRKKETWIDVLIAVSCIAVVYLHVNSIYWTHPRGALWISSSIIEALFYFAVPVFFMISGYTLLDYRKQYDTKTFIKKRLRRVFAPYLLWAFIFFLYYRQQGFFLRFLNGDILSVYWFFPSLFVCYLSIIFLSLIPQKMSNFKWLFAWSFLSYSVVPFLWSTESLGISSVWQSPIGGDFLLYIFLGYLLGNTQIPKGGRIFLYNLGAFGLFCHLVGTIAYTSETGPINTIFKEYRNFPCVLYSVAVFTFFKHGDWSFITQNKILNWLLKTIVSCSLGVYLTHVYFVCDFWPNLFNKLGMYGLVYRDIYRIVAPPIITLGICLLIVFVSKLLPRQLHCLLGYKRD